MVPMHLNNDYKQPADNAGILKSSAGLELVYNQLKECWGQY